MDIFKLLSRSTKLTNSKDPARKAPTQKLPSSGTPSNPQLFGDSPAIETQKFEKDLEQLSKKRKRGQGIPSQPLPAELDFFGDGTARTNGEERQETRIARQGEHAQETNGKVASTKQEHESEANGSTGLLSEEECKRILRTHKVKITVLENHQRQEEETLAAQKSKKKKRKAEQQPEASAPKKAKLQLYPQPLTSFAQLRSRYGISRRLAENIKTQGYTVPTEVQLASLPLLLAGGRTQSNGKDPDMTIGSSASGMSVLDHGIDLLTVAPTGSGKTLAFLILVLDALIRDRKYGREQEQGGHGRKGGTGPKAVIVAPTKELAGQIVNEGRKLAIGTGVRITLMRKGMEVVARSENGSAQPDNDKELTSDDEDKSDAESDHDSADGPGSRKNEKRGRGHTVKSDILVSTPLTLLNALKGSSSTSPLPNVRHLILDEADVLLDPLFRDQTLAIWSACISPSLHVSLWSATMGSSIESLASTTISSRWQALHTTNSTHRPPLIRLVVGLKDTALPTITHTLTYAATEQGKLLALRQLLHPTATADAAALRPPFLVFTQTIPRAVALHAELKYDIPPEAGGSSRIAVLHADLSDRAREDVMRRFRRGEVWVLITTDLLARGVDFRGVNGVVNYDVPGSAAAYVHRVGRTGRAGREGGVAVTLYTKEDVPYVKVIANVIRASERMAGREGEAGVQQWLLDMLPTPSKREKKELKRRGVEARRGEGSAKARISTKSGYERRLENRRKGAVVGSRLRRAERGDDAVMGGAVSDGEFEGFGD